LSGDAEQRLFDALQRKAMDEIAELTANIDPALANMLRSLARLCGGREVLDAARAAFVGAPVAVLEALESLIGIAEQLAVRYPGLPLYFDLGELRGYHYHTGVVFAVFVPGVGQSIAQGGRYDDIGADFGRARPATGFSTDLKTLVSLGNADLVPPTAGIWAPYSKDPVLWRTICLLREQGERVVQALDGQQCDAAPSVGCDRHLLLNDNSWIVTPLGQ
jgi:ATP phosphoribosyltransferase regulatory subunit